MIAAKVIGIMGSIMLTVFSGMFGLVALCCLFTAVVEKDFFSALATAACVFLAWMFWSIRKDTLV